MTRHKQRVNTRASLMLVMGLLLTACDGGIFGTGGPDEINMSTADVVVDTAGDTGSTINSAAPEASDTGAGTTSGGGLTEGSVTEGETDDGTTSGSDTPALGTSEFTNTQTTLDTADISINLVNTASAPVNAIESALANATLLFGDDGVSVNTLSNTATLQQNNTSVDIIDNSMPPATLTSFPAFNVSDATLTTLLVRQNEGQIDTIPLATLTKTADASLAKVRIVQADALNDANAEAMFQLQSAGANPGGIDESFGPLSFTVPVSDYKDIPNGDYELIDSLGRIDTQMLSFIGGNVYTIIVLDDSVQPILVVNDTESGS